MNSRARLLATALLTLACATACGSGDSSSNGGGGDGRQFSVKYDVRTDADRTLRIKLTGSFTAHDDKSEADAGETEIFVHTKAKAEVTNVSDGRDTDDFKHGVELFLPSASCPGWISGADGKVGPYCSYELFDIDIDELDAGDDTTVDIDRDDKVASVKVDQAPGLLKNIMGKTGVLLSADRVFWNGNLEKYNPTCRLPGGDGVKWVTYFTENKKVNACSTENAS